MITFKRHEGGLGGWHVYRDGVHVGQVWRTILGKAWQAWPDTGANYGEYRTRKEAAESL